MRVNPASARISSGRWNSMMRAPLSCIARTPTSVDSDVTDIYITDWGVDNNDDPDENDGKVYEMTLPLSMQ